MRNTLYYRKFFPKAIGSRELEREINLLESIAKVLAISIPIVAIIAGAIQYRISVKNDFRKNFYTEQVGVYNQLIDACSKISQFDLDSLKSPKGSQKIISLTNDFNILYYGKLNLYQNENVQHKTSLFQVSLHRFLRGEEKINNDYMQYLTFQISQHCRESLANTYNVPLDNLLLFPKR